MSNLLQQTLGKLSEHDLTMDDVLWIGSDDVYMDKDDFMRSADVEYDSGYGGQEVAADLKIVGENWWLSRGEYDGSEWWSFNTLPKKPENVITGDVALVMSQSASKGNGCRYWSNLSEMNGISE